MKDEASNTILCRPIGHIKVDIRVKHQLPSQGFNHHEEKNEQWQQQALIELLPHQGFDQALEGLEGFDYIWVVSWMHQAVSSRQIDSAYYHDKRLVNPPGLDKKVGVFATRSPHHPNPIGLSRVRLLEIRGHRLKIEGCDLLDGTPILDLKPYVVSADSVQGANCGWIDERQARLDEQNWQIAYSQQASLDLEKFKEDAYLQKKYIERALRFGPKSSSSNRLKKKDAEGKTYELALGHWRVVILVEGSWMKIEKIHSLE